MNFFPSFRFLQVHIAGLQRFGVQRLLIDLLNMSTDLIRAVLDVSVRSDAGP